MDTSYTVIFEVPIVVTAAYGDDDIENINKHVSGVLRNLSSTYSKRRKYTSSVKYYIDVELKSFRVSLNTNIKYIRRETILFEALGNDGLSSYYSRVRMDVRDAVFETKIPIYGISYKYRCESISSSDMSNLGELLSCKLTQITQRIVGVEVDNEMIHIAFLDDGVYVPVLSPLVRIINSDDFYTVLGGKKLSILIGNDVLP